jgi:hypothetical protein
VRRRFGMCDVNSIVDICGVLVVWGFGCLWLGLDLGCGLIASIVKCMMTI